MQARRGLAAALSIVGLLLILYFPALWLWQVFRWLESGLWVPLPAMLAFQNLPALRALASASNDPVTLENMAVLDYLPQLPRPAWMDTPKEWLGVHKIVMWLLENAHIGLLVAAVGAVCLVIGGYLYPRRPALPIADD